MFKKAVSFSIGTKGIILVIFSWLLAYFIYLFAKDKGWEFLALIAKAYLVITLGFIVFIFGFVILILLLIFIFIILMILFGNYSFRRFYKIKSTKHRRRKKEDDKVVIDADYEVRG